MADVAPTPDTNNQKKTLREIFNDFAADAAERFPEISGKLLVVDMNEHRVHGFNHLDPKKTKLTKEEVPDYLDNHSITREMDIDKEASSCTIYDSKKDINIIFINDTVKPGEREGVSRETQEHLLFVLDHELGHCAIKNGFGTRDGSLYSSLMAETVADAYALLRHYQRFGTESAHANKYVDPAARAFNFIVGGDTEHFTSFVLDEIIKRKDQIDLSSLSAQQTSDLARRFALEYMPSSPTVMDLNNAFSDVRKEFRKNMAGGVKALIEKTLDPKSDYYTFKLGNMWLKEYLKTRTFADGAPIRLPQDYMDDAIKRLKEREMKFAQEDILFNTPVRAQGPKNNPPAPPKLAA